MHMPKNFQYNKLVGANDDLEAVFGSKPLPPFSGIVIHFLDELSRRLFNNPKARSHNDVISFAFWCRKSSLSKMEKNWQSTIVNRIGRGVLFHIAPTNVPVKFCIFIGNRSTSW